MSIPRPTGCWPRSAIGTRSHERYYRHPIEQVWAAVTTSDLNGRPRFSLGGPAQREIGGHGHDQRAPHTVQYTFAHPESHVRFELAEAQHPSRTGTSMAAGSRDPSGSSGRSRRGRTLPAVVAASTSSSTSSAFGSTAAGSKTTTSPTTTPEPVTTSAPLGRLLPEPHPGQLRRPDVGARSSCSRRSQTVSTTDRRYVGRDERKLVPLEDQARSNVELLELVMALTPEQRLMATFVHYPGSTDAPQLAEVWVAPGARIHPRAQDRHGVGFVIGGEIELEGQALGGSSFFIPRGWPTPTGPGPGRRSSASDRRDLLRSGSTPCTGWGADEGVRGAVSASTIRSFRAEERNGRCSGSGRREPGAAGRSSALPPTRGSPHRSCTFVAAPRAAAHRDLAAPGIRIAPFTQELHGELRPVGRERRLVNSGQPGVAVQPFQVGPRGASSIGFRPIRPRTSLFTQRLHGGPLTVDFVDTIESPVSKRRAPGSTRTRLRRRPTPSPWAVSAKPTRSGNENRTPGRRRGSGRCTTPGGRASRGRRSTEAVAVRRCSRSSSIRSRHTSMCPPGCSWWGSGWPARR